MSKYHLCSKNEYKNYFSGKSKKTNSKAYYAYQFALDTRKFEIELYWSRSNLFWSFVGATFTGYFALLALNVQKPKLLLLISLLGWVFSLIWYLVCRGSKYWQENWEKHIDLLEDKFSGPIYRIISNPKKCNFFNPVDSYPISVSKLNMILSLIVSFIWIILISYSFIKLYNSVDFIQFLILLIATIIGMILFVIFTPIIAKTNTKIEDTNNQEDMIIRE